jgi:glucosamine kinase
VSGRVVGLDVGGSKTHAVLADGTGVLAETVVGSANLASVGAREATGQLSTALDRLGATDVDAVCAGAAGADSPEQRDQLAALLAGLLPAARIEVVHDAQLLLAAAGLEAGIALISGTGSVAWGLTPDGRSARAGGWGYLLGDEGSGYWLGREAVRHSLRRMNQGLQPDELTTALLASCGVDHPNKLIALFHSAATGRRYWAQQARLVVEAADAGHEASRELVDQAGRDLAQLAEQTLRQLGIEGPVILGSGLGMNVPRLQESFRAALAAGGIRDVRVLDQDPVFGVLRLVAENG